MPPERQVADTVVHRFSWLPYDHSGAAGHVGVLVVVCDCGWNDLTSSGQGTGIDVAALFADHVKGTHNDGPACDAD